MQASIESVALALPGGALLARQVVQFIDKQLTISGISGIYRVFERVGV